MQTAEETRDETTLAEAFARADKPEPLTPEMLEEAIRELPKHRTDLINSARSSLSLVRRGIPIKTNAPVWIQIQNVIFVSKIDVDFDDEGDE